MWSWSSVEQKISSSVSSSLTHHVHGPAAPVYLVLQRHAVHLGRPGGTMAHVRCTLMRFLIQ